MSKLNTIFLLAVMLIPLVLFQNCGQLQSALEADHSSVAYLAVETYPSAEESSFYNAIMLYNQESAIEKLKEFRFVGSVAYADDSTLPIDYEVRILTRDGMPLCPTKSGTLAAGTSTIEFDCVASAVSLEANVVMKVKAGSAEHIFLKQI